MQKGRKAQVLEMLVALRVMLVASIAFGKGLTTREAMRHIHD